MLNTRWGQTTCKIFGLAAVLMFAVPAFARDRDDDSDRSDDQRQTASDDDHTEHHAALGVSLDDSSGRAKVIAVLPGSPAAKAGLRVGDEISSIDDERIRTAEGLIDEITEQKPGSKVQITIRRNGEKQTLAARLASHEATFGAQNRWSNRRASYDSEAGQGLDFQRHVLRQLRSLQQQVAQLEQEVDQLRGYQVNRRYSTGYRGNRMDSTWRDGRTFIRGSERQYRDEDRDHDDND